nr:hypothetical protein [Candidatus Njordarchaeota archaeon]
MSKGGHADAERRLMIRSIALCTIIAVVAVLIVVFLRLTSVWETAFKTQPILMALPIILLGVSYAAILVSVANRREMGRAVSGWFDVLSLMVAEGILAFLIFGDFLYVSLVILLCSIFVLYVHLAQLP